MQTLLQTVGLFCLAAFCELGGAYLIWQWQRSGKPVWWALIGTITLFFYGLVQTAQNFGFGRAFAAYGGIFIAGALLWGWIVDGHAPDVWDVVGAVICLIGAGVILFAPRS
ncbi:MAG: YnfA family protein [Anaerolineae bacterium]